MKRRAVGVTEVRVFHQPVINPRFTQIHPPLSACIFCPGVHRSGSVGVTALMMPGNSSEFPLYIRAFD